jgi:hypothetical protein
MHQGADYLETTFAAALREKHSRVTCSVEVAWSCISQTQPSSDGAEAFDQVRDFPLVAQSKLPVRLVIRRIGPRPQRSGIHPLAVPRSLDSRFTIDVALRACLEIPFFCSRRREESLISRQAVIGAGGLGMLTPSPAILKHALSVLALIARGVTLELFATALPPSCFQNERRLGLHAQASEAEQASQVEKPS